MNIFLLIWLFAIYCYKFGPLGHGISKYKSISQVHWDLDVHNATHLELQSRDMTPPFSKVAFFVTLVLCSYGNYFPFILKISYSLSCFFLYLLKLWLMLNKFNVLFLFYLLVLEGSKSLESMTSSVGKHTERKISIQSCARKCVLR